ncbi:MAG: hypothetical protein KKF98_11230 [Bacteroidetes bacterium]|nr:hypothetical protein [Bacteroidota bacterium]
MTNIITQPRIRQLLAFTMTIALIITSSCKKSDPVPTTDDQLEFIEEYEITYEDLNAQIAMLPDDPNVYDYPDLLNEMRLEAEEPGLHALWVNKVSYWSVDNQGKAKKLTGLIIHPVLQFNKMPLISLNHGTVLEKKFGPSHFNPLKVNEYLDFAEVVIAEAMASWYGWTIIMPDYQGMGDDKDENHPYCNTELLGIATADMIKAAKATLIKRYHINWTGKTFLIGYSEGGFVTMSAARELEKRNEAFNGSACLDGPYDLSGTMLDLMLSDNPFPVPYFLPMLLVGYNTMYPALYPYDQMLVSPYKEDIPKYTTGFYSTSQVNSIMPENHILKTVFTPAFIDTLTTHTSKAYVTLQNNNSYVNWTPKTEMLIWHCKNDDCVPFGNYEKAKTAFGTLSNVSFVEWPAVDPVFGQPIHVSVAPRAFKEGASWIYHRAKY